MKAFIALILYMGLVKLHSYKVYWSKHHLINFEGIQAIMSRDRFLNILQFFHCNNNDAVLPEDDPQYDPAYKITGLSSLLVHKWQSAYTPAREISVDETLIAFKGRTKFMNYMPAKPHKWGPKSWTLAEAKTGYVYNWQLSTGKKQQPPQPGRNVTHQTVMEVCEPVLNKGYHMYCDNYFTSPALFQELADEQTGACGTLRVNRLGVPEDIKSAKPKPGEDAITNRQDKLLFISWMDKRPVNLLTTLHNTSTVDRRIRSKRHVGHYRDIEQPKAIRLYTLYMSGVDRVDQQISYSTLQHRMLKWWKKIALCNLLEICMANTKVIWKTTHKKTHVDTHTFRLEIITGLLEGYARPQRPFSRPVTDPPSRLTEKTFFSLCPVKNKRW